MSASHPQGDEAVASLLHAGPLLPQVGHVGDDGGAVDVVPVAIELVLRN